MWLVAKHHRGTERDRAEVPADEHAALIRWYTAAGTEEDEKQGVALVQRAKTSGHWMACDCLGPDAAPPLLSPAYLSEAETYYLRRLTGAGRPEHDPDCPFFRDQVILAKAKAARADKPLAPVDGYFAALKPIGEHLAQKPDDSAEDSRVRGPSTPRLARLLWQLIETARTNIIEAVGSRGAPGIAVEHQRLRAAATDLWIAPRTPLASHIYSHPDDLRSNRIYARLRRAEGAWPAEHEPQAFLLVFAKDVTKRSLVTPSGEPITVATDIVKPATKRVEQGPYLALVAVGKHARARGYAAVRAYAQPIQDGRHFVPVNSDGERRLLATLMRLQWDLHARGVSVRIKKPVFDIQTKAGPCRPDFMLDVHQQATARRRITIDLSGSTTARDLRSKEVTLARLRRFSRVVEVAAGELDDQAALARRLAVAIMGPG